MLRIEKTERNHCIVSLTRNTRFSEWHYVTFGEHRLKGCEEKECLSAY